MIFRAGQWNTKLQAGCNISAVIVKEREQFKKMEIFKKLVDALSDCPFGKICASVPGELRSPFNPVVSRIIFSVDTQMLEITPRGVADLNRDIERLVKFLDSRELKPDWKVDKAEIAEKELLMAGIISFSEDAGWCEIPQARVELNATSIINKIEATVMSHRYPIYHRVDIVVIPKGIEPLMESLPLIKFNKQNEPECRGVQP